MGLKWGRWAVVRTLSAQPFCKGKEQKGFHVSMNGLEQVEIPL
jgi:hypothetical protein